MCEQATGPCQGHKCTSKPAAIYRRQQSNSPSYRPLPCIKALRWELTAACLASSPLSAGRSLFVLVFFGHIIAKRANNEGPFCLYSLVFFFFFKERRSTQVEFIIPSVNPTGQTCFPKGCRWRWCTDLADEVRGCQKIQPYILKTFSQIAVCININKTHKCTWDRNTNLWPSTVQANN